MTISNIGYYPKEIIRHYNGEYTLTLRRTGEVDEGDIKITLETNKDDVKLLFGNFENDITLIIGSIFCEMTNFSWCECNYYQFPKGVYFSKDDIETLYKTPQFCQSHQSSLKKEA